MSAWTVVHAPVEHSTAAAQIWTHTVPAADARQTVPFGHVSGPSATDGRHLAPTASVPSALRHANAA